MAISIKKPTKGQIFLLRAMIFFGIISIISFLYWYFTALRFDSVVLYGFVTLSLGYKILRILLEWYYVWSVRVPTPKSLTRAYKVDMLTTYYPGEPREMVKNTLLAMKNVRYPHHTVLCSEGDDEELEAFCQQHSIQFIPRYERTDAKAGNINNGLKQCTGEICVILDPDHEPFPDFLDRVLPSFEEENVGFVQVVQAYKNQGESFIAKAAAEQTYLFYGPVMMGMYGKETAQAIGANCTFRRKALDSIGGHAAGLTEDMHTSMLLHSNGWKSVYIPEIIAKGQVPASFSAYTQQQLKWSRGSFDLLFNVYPRIFHLLSLRQRIYYFTICLYFLIGLITILDLFVPIVSLWTSRFPIFTDFKSFLWAIGPISIITMAIRMYLKRWLYETQEKILFWRSGLLILSAWYAYLVGFIYAIINRKVPYIPTVKGSQLINEFKIHLPNILIALLSGTAIITGLQRDFTPFSITMSGFAGFNAMALIYVAASGQNRRWKGISGRVSGILKKWFEQTGQGLARILTFISPVLVLSTVVYLALYYYGSLFSVSYTGTDYSEDQPLRSGDANTVLTGVYFDTPDTSVLDKNYNIASLYVAWGTPDSLYPKLLIDQLIKGGKTPMITWEPWSSTFDVFKTDSLLSNEIGVFKAICDGRFDFYIDRFIGHIKQLDAPVFLRFAHEMGNPQYGWKNNSPEDYINGWRYIHQRFAKNKVENVIWVWNPWKNEVQYYPGKQYVDWIGLTMLNYGNIEGATRWTRFVELYHKQSYLCEKLNKPVMLAEFGSTNLGGDQHNWVRESLSDIETFYPEIKAIVFFESDKDNYWPDFRTTDQPLKWALGPALDPILSSVQDTSRRTYLGIVRGHSDQNRISIPHMHYNVDNNWSAGYRPLTRKQLQTDFPKIKEQGDVLFRKKCDVYAYNVLDLASENELEVLLGFDFSPNIDYFEDLHAVDSVKNAALSYVLRLKDKPALHQWVLDYETYDHLKYYFAKPYLYTVQDAYLKMLNELEAEISASDPQHRCIRLDPESSVMFSDAYVGHTMVFGCYNFYGMKRTGDLKTLNMAVPDTVVSGPDGILNSNYPYFENRSYTFTAETQLAADSVDKIEWVLCDDGVFELDYYEGKRVNIVIPTKVRGNLVLRLNIYTLNGGVRTSFKKLELG